MKVGLKLKTLSNPETENIVKDYTTLYGKDFSVLYKCNSLHSGYSRDLNNNNEIDQNSNYYKQVNTLVEKLIEISGNDKFAELIDYFKYYYPEGQNRTEIEQIKETAEHIFFQLQKASSQGVHMNNFSGHINNATFACAPGGLDNLLMLSRTFTNSLQQSIYNAKYEYLQNLARTFLHEQKFLRNISYSPNNEIHLINSLLREISGEYALTIPEDKYASYLRVDILADKFEEFVEKEFSSALAAETITDIIVYKVAMILPDDLEELRMPIFKQDEYDNKTAMLKMALESILGPNSFKPNLLFIINQDFGIDGIKPNYIDIIKCLFLTKLEEKDYLRNSLSHWPDAVIFNIQDHLYYHANNSDEFTKLIDYKSLIGFHILQTCVKNHLEYSFVNEENLTIEKLTKLLIRKLCIRLKPKQNPKTNNITEILFLLTDEVQNSISKGCDIKIMQQLFAAKNELANYQLFKALHLKTAIWQIVRGKNHLALEVVLQEASSEQLKNMLISNNFDDDNTTALVYAIKNNDHYAFNKILQAAKKKLSIAQVMELLCNNSYMPILNACILENRNILAISTIHFAREIFNKTELEAFITTPHEIYFDTALIHSYKSDQPDVTTEILKTIQACQSKEEFKKFLMDTHDINPMILAIAMGQVELFNLIISLFSNVSRRNERADLFLIKQSGYISPLIAILDDDINIHLGIEYPQANNLEANKQTLLKQFFKIAKEQFNEKKLIEILSLHDSFGRTALYYAIDNNNLKAFHIIMHTMSKRLSRGNLIKILNKTDNYGNSIFYHAIKEINQQALVELLSIISNKLFSQECFELLNLDNLHKQNQHLSSLLIAAGMTNNPYVEYEPRLEAINIILETAINKFTKKQLFSFINAKNLIGETIFSYAAKLKEPILLKTLCNFVASHFDSKQTLQVLMAKDPTDREIIHSIRAYNPQNLALLIDLAASCLKLEDFCLFILGKDSQTHHENNELEQKLQRVIDKAGLENLIDNHALLKQISCLYNHDKNQKTTLNKLYIALKSTELLGLKSKLGQFLQNPNNLYLLAKYTEHTHDIDADCSQNQAIERMDLQLLDQINKVTNVILKRGSKSDSNDLQDTCYKNFPLMNACLEKTISALKKQSKLKYTDAIRNEKILYEFIAAQSEILNLSFEIDDIEPGLFIDKILHDRSQNNLGIKSTKF